MLNNIIRLLKETFEMILFLVLAATMPLWILPYTLATKHKEKKYESRDSK